MKNPKNNAGNTSNANIENLTDQQLFNMARRFGKNTLVWRRKFIGILPEIYKRRIYEKNYESIFVFAKKLAGLSEEQVRRTLNLEKKFQNMPNLHTALTGGEVSVNKLARVTSIATPENEEALAEKLRVLPNRAVETFVRDEKAIQNGLCKPKLEAKSVHVHKLKNDLELSEEVSKKLLELQEKGININEMLLEMLKKRDEEIQQEKEEIAENLEQTESRYIPVKIKRIIKKEHGNKCSICNCNKPAVTIHHTQPFACSKIHDPRYLAPLCKEHHAIAHSINLKIQRKRHLKLE